MPFCHEDACIGNNSQMNDAVSRAMPRKIFEDVLRCMHVADNNPLDKGDVFAKVRPLLAQLKYKRWVMLEAPDSYLYID